VADQGIGIPTEDLERVFSRHVRLDRQEQLGIPGSGLGLQIARNIVEQHGGRVWAEQACGGGSVFQIELPRSNRHRPSDAD
jgi:two-component system sensor histidine kinase VicK